MTDWSNCVDADFNRYNYALDTELCRIKIPKELLALQNVQELHGASPVGYICLLDVYYNSVVSCIKAVCNSTLPSRRITSHCEQYIIPRWNDILVVSMPEHVRHSCIGS